MKPTPAQRAIDKKLTSLITEMDQRWSAYDLERLAMHLRNCKSDSIWGSAIKKAFRDEPDATTVNLLIEQLAGQAIDDFVTMIEIVGITATLLLLRFYDAKNPNK